MPRSCVSFLGIGISNPLTRLITSKKVKQSGWRKFTNTYVASQLEQSRLAHLMHKYRYWGDGRALDNEQQEELTMLSLTPSYVIILRITYLY